VVTRRGKNNNAALLPKDAVVGAATTTTNTNTASTETPVNFKAKKSSADVYEFKEDSEDEVKRPRLILTIKNPVEPTATVTPHVAVTEPPSVAITECKPVVAAATAVVTNQPVPAVVSQSSGSGGKNTSPNTRKSRRLQVCVLY
jgi:hypothetical protein